MVIRTALKAMDSLTELRLFQNHELYEILNEAYPLLMHPSIWIRQALASFIKTAFNSLSYVLGTVKIMPHLMKYQKHELGELDT